MKEEYQSNASQLPTEIVHDIQYARFHEVSESDVRALLQTYQTPAKAELARRLTVGKRNISKDGDIIRTSKRKDRNYKGM